MNTHTAKPSAPPSERSFLSRLMARAFSRLPSTSEHKPGFGTARPAPRRHNYALETIDPRLLLSASLDTNGLLTVAGSLSPDDIVIQQTAPLVASSGASIRVTLNSVVQNFTGVQNITVNAGLGNDLITVQGNLALPDEGELLLYGNNGGAPSVLGTLDVDEVVINGDITIVDGYLEVFADHITVAANQVLELGEGDIVFRARHIDNSDVNNFLPVGVADRDVEIVIGTNTELRAGGIYLIAQAEDRNSTTLLGTDRLTNTFIIEPLQDLVSDLTALPVKVLFKASSASITLQSGVQLVGSDTVGVYATAVSDASGQAASTLFSLGYAQSDASAEVDIGADVLIQAGAAVVVTADASATANMATETAQELGASGFAVSMAVTNAAIISRITMHQTAVVDAGKTANLQAHGDIVSEAEAEGGTFADGTAGIALGLSFSDSDIRTEVNGTVIARVDPGSAVSFYIDPTETNPSKPGYIDYANNMINVGAHALVTEDAVEYDTRRGFSIGGLTDDASYVLIALEDDPLTTDRDESNFIQLAITEQKAIDGEAVDLVVQAPPLAVSNNAKDFTGDRVDGARDKIALDNQPNTSANGVDYALLGQSFELGQPVIYREGSAPISGLVDGKTYYVITGIDEFDLQGDSRFLQKQVIQLAESGGEARAGVAIDIGEVPMTAIGYRLIAKHVIHSEYVSGVGIVADLKAEDKASASAGVKDEEEPVFSLDPNPLSGSIFDTILGTLSAPVDDQGSKSGVKTSSISAAGALAFSFANHVVKTDVGSQAVIKSNQDLEVKATIDQEVQLSAESETDPGEQDTDTQQTGNQPPPPSTVSVAVDVGLYTADAQVMVHGGAQLDALRATRVIAIVEHPYLTSPDELFPC